MFLKEIKLNYKDQGLHFNSKIQKCYITDSGHETEFAVLKYFQKNAELLKQVFELLQNQHISIKSMCAKESNPGSGFEESVQDEYEL